MDPTPMATPAAEALIVAVIELTAGALIAGLITLLCIIAVLDQRGRAMTGHRPPGWRQ